MADNKIKELGEFGQSIWLDYISRSMIDSGKLQKMIDLGVLGMTSNPTIFNQAISTANDYDGMITFFTEEGKTTFEIYDQLTIRDIQDAADLFHPVYEATKKDDGYVSLEINPKLANDKEGSIEEALRLLEQVNRPNLMIKVPATSVGAKIIEELISQGVNVNATLIFSPDQYWQTAWAYFKGLEKYAQSHQDLNHIRSVASIFVSRIDTAVDRLIAEKMKNEEDQEAKDKLRSLQGKAAVANSVIIFDKFNQMFSSDYFSALAAKGANIQRVLWASTGTKNPEYGDIKYVTELIAKPTVNTLPEKTLNAFLDHGQMSSALPSNVNKAQEIFSVLHQYGIDIDEIHRTLLNDGVAAFIKSFDALIESIQEKAETLCSQS